MAKKKKKLTRLNTAIRHIFDDLSFDEGIELVDKESLVELTHALGIIPDAWEKEDLVRLYRRLWSEADVAIRQLIVDFFKAQNRTYHSDRPKEAAIEKSDKINEILEEMDITKEEARELFNAFIDLRTKKINRGKMEHKLAHLRFDKKKKQVEKALDGQFDLEDRFVFNHAFTYTIFSETFKKIQPVKSAIFSYTYLNESEAGTLITELTAIKTTLTEIKQQQIDDFLQTLTDKHPYLSTGQTIAALKSSPPSEDITLPLLNDTVLKNILFKEISAGDVQQGEYEVVLGLTSHFSPPFLEKPLDYSVHLALDKQELLQKIWQGEPLTITDELEAAKKESEENFLHDLGDLIGECSEQAKLLELDEPTLYGMVYEQMLPLLNKTLHITAKISRKILFHFNLHPGTKFRITLNGLQIIKKPCVMPGYLLLKYGVPQKINVLFSKLIVPPDQLCLN